MKGRPERYVRLLRSTWNQSDWRALSRHAQWCYMMLISQHDISAAGVLPLMERRWSRYATDVALDDIDVALDELVGAGFVVVDHETSEVWVRTYIRHDGLWRSPNGRKAVESAVESILSHPIRLHAQTTVDNLTNPQVDGNVEGATEGASQGATEGDTAPQQPAALASSHKPAASSQQPDTTVESVVDNSSTDRTSPPLAAFRNQVIDEMVAQRVRATRNVRSPQRLSATLRRSLNDEHGDLLDEALERYGAEPPISAIAHAVLSGKLAPLARYTDTRTVDE